MVYCYETHAGKETSCIWSNLTETENREISTVSHRCCQAKLSASFEKDSFIYVVNESICRKDIEKIVEKI